MKKKEVFRLKAWVKRTEDGAYARLYVQQISGDRSLKGSIPVETILEIEPETVAQLIQNEKERIEKLLNSKKTS